MADLERVGRKSRARSHFYKNNNCVWIGTVQGAKLLTVVPPGVGEGGIFSCCFSLCLVSFF